MLKDEITILALARIENYWSF